MKPLAKADARTRLAKIEGQIRGLQQMISEERDSLEVLTQVAAVRAALESLGSIVLTEHVDECFGALREGNGVTEDEYERRTERVRQAMARLLR
jgi:DNA-binding FrmR family transcriptional regulator